MEAFLPDSTSISPVLGTNEHGEAVAAWVWSYNGISYIRVSYYDPSSGWSSPMAIDQNGSASMPAVAIDKYGTAVVVWAFTKAGVKYVAGCAYKDGEGWGPSQVLNPEGATAISSLTVVSERPANFTAVFLQSNSTSQSVNAVRYSPLLGFDTDPTVLTQSPDVLMDLAVSTNGAGQAWATWTEMVTGKNLMMVMHASNGTWETSPHVLSADNAVYPAVGVTDNGTALAAYCRYDASRAIVVGVDNLSSEWSEPSELLNVTGALEKLTISANGNGRGILCALVSNSTSWSIYIAEHDGTAWSNMTLITSSTDLIFSISLDQDSDDGAKLAYVTITFVPTTTYHIMVLTRTDEGSWGSPEERENIGGSSAYAFFDLAASGVDYWLIFSRFEFDPLSESRIWIDQFRGIASGDALLTVDESLINSTVNVPSVELRGTAEPGSIIYIDGLPVYVGEDGNYSVALPLKEGKNTFTITTTDSMGRYAVEQVTVTYSYGTAETAGLLAVILGALAIIVSLVIMVLFIQYKRMKD